MLSSEPMGGGGVLSIDSLEGSFSPCFSARGSSVQLIMATVAPMNPFVIPSADNSSLPQRSTDLDYREVEVLKVAVPSVDIGEMRSPAAANHGGVSHGARNRPQEGLEYEEHEAHVICSSRSSRKRHHLEVHSALVPLTSRQVSAINFSSTGTDAISLEVGCCDLDGQVQGTTLDGDEEVPDSEDQ